MSVFKFMSMIGALMVATPVLANGDVENGAKTFKKCKACHMIASSDETIVRGGKIGPNLFEIIGTTAGTAPDFRYGKDIVAAGEAGLVWDETNLAAYLVNPTSFLKETLGKNGAKSSMNFRLNKGGEDVAAYLASLGSVAPDENETQKSE